MTILDIKNQIVSHFLSSPKFSKEDFAGITVSSAFNEFRDEMAISALKELEQAGILAQIGKETWVLSKPLEYQDQIVQLDISLAARISDTINAFFKANGLESEMGVDVTNISSNEIDTLLDIIEELSDDGDGINDEDEDDLGDSENWKK